MLSWKCILPIFIGGVFSVPRPPAPTDAASSSLWVGAHTLFTPNMWEWVSGEGLQTGVPFWAYAEQYDSNENCAAADGSYYYRLVPSSCDQPK